MWFRRVMAVSVWPYVDCEDLLHRLIRKAGPQLVASAGSITGCRSSAHLTDGSYNRYTQYQFWGR
jgi:hypothetical protein